MGNYCHLMELEGSVSILANEDGVEITIHDSASSYDIAVVKMTPQQFCQAMSRLVNTPVSVYVTKVPGRIGKIMEVDHIEFPLPKNAHPWKHDDKVTSKHAEEFCKVNRPGWEPDNYFGSQGSYFTKENQQWARCTIRRWVDPKDHAETKDEKRVKR